MARIHGLKLVGPRLEVGSKIKNQGLVKTSKKSILGSDGPILDDPWIPRLSVAVLFADTYRILHSNVSQINVWG